MKANTRLSLIAFLIVGSALYAFLIAKDPKFAEAIALGYIAMLLTVLTIINVWKRP